MNKEELDKILQNDPYHKKRENPTEADLRLFLLEVNNHCPLCGKLLQSKQQKKKEQKLFQIAHIYPNSPTIEQYNVLHTLDRLGKSSEDFENKIALCIDCHQTQDFHTTKQDYLELLNIKKNCLRNTALSETITTLGLEDEIKNLIKKIIHINEKELVELNYAPVPLKNKFQDE